MNTDEETSDKVTFLSAEGAPEGSLGRKPQESETRTRGKPRRGDRGILPRLRRLSSWVLATWGFRPRLPSTAASRLYRRVPIVYLRIYLCLIVCIRG